MISHEYKCIFIHVPHTAGTAIEVTLVGKNWFDVDPKTKHLDWKDTKSIYSKYWDSYFKFSVVRNPFDWTVALYNRYDYVRSSSNHLKGSRRGFKAFLRKPKLGSLEQKAFTQSEIIGEQVNLIIRFENLKEGFDTLCTQLGLPHTTLPFVSNYQLACKRNHKTDEFYYDDEVIKIVSKNWMDDLDRFDYSYDNSKINELRQRNEVASSPKTKWHHLLKRSGIIS